MFEGPMSGLLIRLSMPILMGMLVQLLYNITDMTFVSRIDSADPSYVGSTGLVFPLIFLAMSLASGLMTGVGSVVARAIGEQSHDSLGKAAESALFMAVVLSIIVVASGYLFAEPLVKVLGAEGDFYNHGLDYFHYMLPFTGLMICMHAVGGIFQGEGKMKRIMIAMFIGTAVNIALDPIFIFVCNMDVRGAGLASVVGQGAAFVYVLISLGAEENVVKIQWKVANISLDLMKKIAVIGFPMSMGQMAMAASMLLFNRIIIDLDAKAVTAFALVGRFDQAVLMPIFAMSSAMITIVGQNAGRGKYDRIRNAWKTALTMGFSVVFVLALVHVLVAPKLYGLFSDVTEVVTYAVTQVRILEFSFLLAVIGIIGRSVFQAIGYPLPALALTAIRTLAVGVPLAAVYAYVFDWGVKGVYFGILTGNSATALVGVIWIMVTLKRLEAGTLKVSTTTMKK